ncbi:MAG TPA: zinc-ribbon domain-containing protein, partial [Polyangiaceae bacterium]|nr:zinc-ribbon domain-containing protein [Polyangiaceae bacterium]
MPAANSPRSLEPLPPTRREAGAVRTGEPLRSRPEAPVFDFSPRRAEDGPAPCQHCGTVNPTGSRFCSNCGQSLTASGGSPLPPPAAPSAPLRMLPEPPAPGDLGGPAVGAPGPIQQPGAPTGPLPQFSLAMDGAVAPAPVLGIAPAVTAEPRRVPCGRCGGANAAGMPFCQYCGAPLGDPAVAAGAPLAPVVSPVPSLVVFPGAAGPAGSPGAAGAAESPPG